MLLPQLHEMIYSQLTCVLVTLWFGCWIASGYDGSLRPSVCWTVRCVWLFNNIRTLIGNKIYAPRETLCVRIWMLISLPYVLRQDAAVRTTVSEMNRSWLGLVLCCVRKMSTVLLDPMGTNTWMCKLELWNGDVRIHDDIEHDDKQFTSLRMSAHKSTRLSC